MNEIVLSVPEMSCGHCVNAINTSMQKVAGVRDVNVDLEGKVVHLRYEDQKVSLTQIQDALDDAGYSSSLLA